MIRELPKNLQISYGRFDSLDQRKASLHQKIDVGIPTLGQIYRAGLVLWSQYLDLTDHRRLQSLPEATYWRELERVSAFPPLLQILGSGRARGQHQRGYEGSIGLGLHLNRGFLDHTLRAIAEHSPQSLSYPLVRATFFNAPFRYIEEQRQKDLDELGVRPGSTERQLMVLSQLELTAKRGTVLPVVRKIDRYSEKDPVKFATDIPEGLAVIKKKILRPVILGDYRRAKDPQRASHYRKYPEEQGQDAHGTEYYRGAASAIYETMSALATREYGENATLMIFLIKALTFMQTSRYSTEQIKETRGKLVKGIKTDAQRALEILQGLVFDYPHLWSEHVWVDAGMDVNKVREYHIDQAYKGQMAEKFIKENTPPRVSSEDAKKRQRNSSDLIPQLVQWHGQVLEAGHGFKLMIKGFKDGLQQIVHIHPDGTKRAANVSYATAMEMINRCQKGEQNGKS